MVVPAVTTPTGTTCIMTANVPVLDAENSVYAVIRCAARTGSVGTAMARGKDVCQSCMPPLSRKDGTLLTVVGCVVHIWLNARHPENRHQNAPFILNFYEGGYATFSRKHCFRLMSQRNLCPASTLFCGNATLFGQRSPPPPVCTVR